MIVKMNYKLRAYIYSVGACFLFWVLVGLCAFVRWFFRG